MSADRNQDESYFDAVRTLRDSVRLAPERAADIERRLDNAFATHHAIRTPTVKRVESGWWRWMAAAAAVVLAAASVAVWRERAITQNHVIEASRPRADGNLAATSHPSGTSLAPADAHDAPLSTATSAAAARNTDRLRTARVPAHQRPVPKAAQIDVIEPAGFVAVPGAASLPQFESGTIVRLELPVSVLPEYGVDIFPATGQPVEADVLVGQDGQARAIRLVTQSVRSSQ